MASRTRLGGIGAIRGYASAAMRSGNLSGDRHCAVLVLPNVVLHTNLELETTYVPKFYCQF